MYKFPPNLIDQKGKTKLHHLCENQEQQNKITLSFQIKGLIEDIKIGEYKDHLELFINYQDQHKKTALHYICEDNNTDVNVNIVKFLIEEKADPSLQDQNGETILHYFCKRDNTDLDHIKFLIEKKADPSLLNEQGKSCLVILCEKNKPEIDVINILLATPQMKNIVIDEKNSNHKQLLATLLELAFYGKRTFGIDNDWQPHIINPNDTLINLLINNGAYLAQQVYHYAVGKIKERDDLNNKNVQIIAELTGIIECCLTAGVVPDSQYPSSEVIPLTKFCRMKFPPLETIKLLLEHKADPNFFEKTTEIKNSPLLTLFDEEKKAGDFSKEITYEVAKLLLEKNANPNVQDSYGRSLLHRVRHPLEFYKLLLAHKADTNVKDLNGNSPLHKVGYPLEFYKLLLAHKADTNVKDLHGNSLLHKVGYPFEFYELLLESGVEINAQNENKSTPLEHLVYMPAPTSIKREERNKLLKLFFANGADSTIKKSDKPSAKQILEETIKSDGFSRDLQSTTPSSMDIFIEGERELKKAKTAYFYVRFFCKKNNIAPNVAGEICSFVDPKKYRGINGSTKEAADTFFKKLNNLQDLPIRQNIIYIKNIIAFIRDSNLGRYQLEEGKYVLPESCLQFFNCIKTQFNLLENKASLINFESIFRDKDMKNIIETIKINNLADNLSAAVKSIQTEINLFIDQHGTHTPYQKLLEKYRFVEAQSQTNLQLEPYQQQQQPKPEDPPKTDNKNTFCMIF